MDRHDCYCCDQPATSTATQFGTIGLCPLCAGAKFVQAGTFTGDFGWKGASKTEPTYVLDCPTHGRQEHVETRGDWTPWGDTFDTVRADPTTMAAIAIIKEVNRVAKLRQIATDKGKVSKAAVQVDKIATKHKMSQDAVLRAMAGTTVEQVASLLFCKTKS